MKNITCIKSIIGFTLNKEYEVLTSKLTNSFNKNYLVSDNGTKITFNETLSSFFVKRKVLNKKLSLYKDKNIFDFELFEIAFGEILREKSFQFFKLDWFEVGSDIGSNFRFYSDNNGKTISFVKNTFNTWRCVHNDFFLNFNPELPEDFKEWVPIIPEVRNFIHEIIEEDIASGRFSEANTKNKIF